MKTTLPQRSARAGLLLVAVLVGVCAVLAKLQFSSALRHPEVQLALALEGIGSWRRAQNLGADRFVSSARHVEQAKPVLEVGSSAEKRVGSIAPSATHGDGGSFRSDAGPVVSHDGSAQCFYDAEADQLSLRVRNVSLAKVLEAVSNRSGLSFEILPDEVPEKKITARFERIPLAEAVRTLLRGFNKVFLYDSGQRRGSGARLTKVIIISTRDASLELREPWMGRETREAVDTLLQNLDEDDAQSYSAAIHRLKGLAPERTARELVRQLEGAEAENEGDTHRRRVLAAWGLGVVGGESAVAPLMQAFESSDRELRLASANSLQQIRIRQSGEENAPDVERPLPFATVDDEVF